MHMLSAESSQAVFTFLEHGIMFLWITMILGFLAAVFGEILNYKTWGKIFITCAYAFLAPVILNLILAGYEIIKGIL